MTRTTSNTKNSWLLYGISGLLLVAAAVGPLGLSLISFHVSRDATAQYVGGEVATVVIAVSLVLLAKTNQRRFTPLVLGMLVYVIYTFVTVVMGQGYDKHPHANAEYVFLLYAAITALSFTATVSYAATLKEVRKLVSDKYAAVIRKVLISLVVVFAALWALQLLALYSGRQTVEYENDKQLFWLIKYLDYGFVLPAFLLIAHSIKHKSDTARVAGVAAITFSACLTTAIALMAVSQSLAGTVNGWVVAGVMALGAAGLIWLLSRLYREVN